MFLKLKGFKDTSIGIDYTNNNIRNLSDIINKVKEYEKEKNYTNIFFVPNAFAAASASIIPRGTVFSPSDSQMRQMFWET